MIQLRQYQSRLVQQVREALKTDKHIIMQLGTGGGKTIVFSYIAQNAAKKGSRIMICSDRTEILTQNGGALEKFGLDVEYISPKSKHVPKGQVAACMLQTLQRRAGKPEWVDFLQSLNLVVLDEAHTQNSTFLFPLLSAKTYVIGATATPIRSSGQRQLGMDYSQIVQGCSVKELIKQGFLVSIQHYTLDAPDLSAVPYDNKKGDYNHKQMSKVFEKRKKYEGVVKEWFRLTPNTSTIVFCASSEQAIEITKQFCERGVKAKYLLSNSFDDDSAYSGKRSELIDELRCGDLTVLVNVGIAVAGLDVPSLQTCIAAYATTSLSKWLQSIGRVCRPAEGKTEGVCLDFGGNVNRLGLYQDERKWGLWYETSKEGTSPAATKECDQNKPDINGKLGCSRLIPISSRECPFCGYYFANEREIYEVELSLVTEDSRDEKEHLDVYVANRVKFGWSNNRILMTVIAKNAETMSPKQAYMETIQYLRTKDGKPINPKSYYFFSENILKKRKQNDTTI